MQARTVLGWLLFCAALPAISIASLLVRTSFFGIRSDLRKCLEAVDSARPLPAMFTELLAAAEDHRSHMHPGIDAVAIARVAFYAMHAGRVQGASTIEQQLVRVVTCRYERTVQRKLREQLLAVSLSSRRPKVQIATAYLGSAFYGAGKVGYPAIAAMCGDDLDRVPPRLAIELIARLKYPEPTVPSTAWTKHISRRVQYIALRAERYYGRNFELELTQSFML
jgi:monofunctional glycosyltransferase